MTEILRNPTDKEKRRLLEAYGDNIVFGLVRSTIQYLQKPIKNLLANNERDLLEKYYSLTRLMILNFGVNKTANTLYNALEDISSDQWEGFELPRQEETLEIDFITKDDTPIIEIAKSYGIKVTKNKIVCPFHADGNPSLVFYPKTNSFYCFGCNLYGDVIKFVQLMEDKNGN